MINIFLFQVPEILEGFSLNLNKISTQGFFMKKRLVFQRIRDDIVNVLDENNISLKIIKVFQNGPMAPGPKKNPAAAIPEGIIIRSYRHRVGRRFLNRVGDFETVIFLFIFQYGPGKMILYLFQVFLSHSKVKPNQILAITDIINSLNKMLFKRGSGAIRVLMEFNQALWQFRKI